VRADKLLTCAIYEGFTLSRAEKSVLQQRLSDFESFLSSKSSRSWTGIESFLSAHIKSGTIRRAIPLIFRPRNFKTETMSILGMGRFRGLLFRSGTIRTTLRNP
jgi:hypothetical protein